MATPRKILLLGSGYVAGPCADYLLQRPENRLTVATRRGHGPNHPNVTLLALDVGNDTDGLDRAVAQHELVISLVPYTLHAVVIKAAIRHRKHVVTTSYISPAMAALHADAEKAGITVLNEIGVDPGVDHLYALKTIWEVHQRGGKIIHFTSYCGGLPAPECSNNPLGYKFSWSSRGVLLALRNEARYVEHGKQVVVPGPQLLRSAKPIWTGYPAFAFEGYANRDSTVYPERYGIPEAQTVIRGTLRYQGFPEFMQALVNLGLLDDAAVPELADDGPKDLTWRAMLARIVNLKSDAKDPDLEAALVKRAQVTDPDAIKRLISGLRWLGMFDTKDPLPRRGGNLLDCLCATLEQRMQYNEAKQERDMVFLQHRFEAQRKDGRMETITATLVEYGTPKASAMAKTVGVPCAVAVQLILDGKLTRRGVIAPMEPDVVFPLIEAIEKEGITMEEVVY